MNNINKTIAALFMAATFLPMSAQTTAKKECCKEKTECGKTLCCKTGCEKMKQRMDKTASDDVNFATRQYTLMLDHVGRKGKVNNPRTIDKLGRLVCVPIDDVNFANLKFRSIIYLNRHITLLSRACYCGEYVIVATTIVSD